MIEPGSEMLGVPASEIIDTIFLESKISIILLIFLLSLNLWLEINYDLILYFLNKFLETLVSSQSI